MNCNRIKSVVFMSVFCGSLMAHDVITTKLTFSRDISRIFASRCVACHSAGSSIPLVTYEDTRPWAVAIKEQVLSRAMPPWGAVKGFGQLTPDPSLTQEELMIIAAWVIGGAPKGDPAQLPKSKPAAVSALPTTPETAEVLTVATRTTLRTALVLSGLRPITDKMVNSARITATLPNGRVEPLVWLYRYSPHGDGSFRFRDSIRLPERTVIESSAPLRFALLSSGRG